MMPQIAASGIEVAGWPSETPPTKTTASSASRSTVMNGRMNKAHFSVRALLGTSVSVEAPGVAAASSCAVFLRFKRPLCSNAFSSLSRQRILERSTRSMVRAMAKMMMAAMSEKMPSQSSSDWLQRS